MQNKPTLSETHTTQTLEVELIIANSFVGTDSRLISVLTSEKQTISLLFIAFAAAASSVN